MKDRFDFEQGIMNCCSVVDDITMLVEQDAEKEDYAALARVYQIKFDRLFSQFEELVSAGKIL